MIQCANRELPARRLSPSIPLAGGWTLPYSFDAPLFSPVPAKAQYLPPGCSPCDVAVTGHNRTEVARAFQVTFQSRRPGC